MTATTEDRSMDPKTATAVMSMAGRAVRACDVCGRDRARWYCAADEAYLCGRCDNSIHCVNALASRHERVRLNPNGTACKGGERTSSKSFPGLQIRKSSKSLKHHVNPKMRMIKDEMLAQSFFSNPDDTSRVPGYPESLPEDESSRLGLPAYVPDLQASVDDLGGDGSASDGFPMDMPQELDSLERGDEDCVGGSDDEYLDFTDIVTEADFLDDKGDEGSVFSQDDIKSEHCHDAVKNEGFGQFQPVCNDGFESINVKVEKDGSLFHQTQQFSEEGQTKCLSLKLNYEDVLSAWSGRGPLWTEDGGQPQTVPILSNIDMALNLDLESYHREQLGEVPVLGMGEEVSEVGVGREARVMRYREKRRTRLFSKQIRYEVRKLNAERRPRMKGRFVKRLPP
ncbi:protein MpBBX3 [Marchantia polymorpha subsp. ruderalis]